MSVTGYTKSGADTAISTAVGTEASRAEGAESTLTSSLAAKADLVGGKIATSQIPALALSTTVPVADDAARLALTSSDVQPGDLAAQASPPSTYMLVDTDPSQTASWVLLPTPSGGIASVNGQTGAVVLAASDVGADVSGAASSAQSAAETYTDGKITAEVSRADGAYSKVTDNGNGTFTAT